MASRVNKKFIIILSGSIIGLAVLVTGLAWYSVLKSPEHNVRVAKAAYAEGELGEAVRRLGRAVRKDPTNLDTLLLWRQYMSEYTPESRTEYDQYFGFYQQTYDMVARLQPTNAERALEYIEVLNEAVFTRSLSRSGMEMLIEEIDKSLEQLDLEEPEAKKILRYRGLAALEKARWVSLEDQETEQAREDLAQAIEADENDWEAALALIRLDLYEANEFFRTNRIERGEQQLEGVSTALEAFFERFPNNPEGRVLEFQIAQRELSRKYNQAVPEERDLVVAELQAEAQAVLDDGMEAEPELLTRDYLSALQNLVVPTIGQESHEQLVTLIKRAQELDPEDPRYFLLLGETLYKAGEHQPAIDALQRVIEMPRRPVSLEGSMLPQYRANAANRQFDAAISLWNAAPTDEKKAETLAMAEKFLNTLGELVPVQLEDLHAFATAKLYLIKEDYDAAVAKLSALRQNVMVSQVEVRNLLAQALERQGNTGMALRELEELTRDLGAGTPAWIYGRMAELEVRLDQPDKALQHLTMATQIDPANPSYASRLRAIQTLLSPESIEEVDPIVAGLLSAIEKRNSGAYAESREILDKLQKDYPSDYRVIREQIRLDMTEGKRDEALARIDRAIELFPNNRELQAARLSIAEEMSPVQVQAKLIEDSNEAPIEKKLALFQLYSMAGMEAEAKQALSEAEAIDPDNRHVIESNFLIALNENDMARARAMADRAARTNADQLDGLSFVGRIELAEGKYEDAIRTFRTAVDRITHHPGAWHLLGQAQFQAGRMNDAVASLRRAYEGRPDRVETAKLYARALVSLNQGPAALRVVNPSDGILRFDAARADNELMEMWLQLESEYGDRQVARDTRQRIHNQVPGNTANSMALFNMLLTDGAWQEAQGVLDQMAQQPTMNELSVARQQAHLYALQGDVEKGRAHLEGLIEKTPEAERTSAMYTTLGYYMIQYGLEEEGIESFRKAQAYQGAGGEVDRQLGDFFFDREQYADAAKIYEQVIASGADKPEDGYRVSKRLAETYLRMDQYADARRVIEKVAAWNADDLQVLLLQSSIAEDEGDMRTARDRLDRAIEVHPSEWLPFMRRAQVNSTNEERFTDVIADLRQVTRLNPSMVPAWGMLFQMYRSRNQIDEAIVQIRQAIAANPDLDDLQVFFVEQLKEMGRLDQAQAEVRQMVKENPDDDRIKRYAIQLFLDGNNSREAAGLLKELYDKEPTPDNAVFYLDAILRDPAGFTRADVNRLLTKLREFDEKTYNGIIVSMLRSRAALYLGDEDTAADLALQAIEPFREDSSWVHRWFTELRRSFGSSERLFAFLAKMDMEGGMPPYVKVQMLKYRHAVLAETPELILEDSQDLNDIAATDDIIKLELCRLRFSLLTELSRYEEAVAVGKEGLAIYPNDTELNNNVAYVLAEQLNDPASAAPFAEKAVEAAPLSSPALDTLGWIYYKTERMRDAETVLGRAVNHSANDAERIIALLHLGMARVQLGDTRNAERHLADAEAIARRDPRVAEYYKSDLESLRQALK